MSKKLNELTKQEWDTLFPIELVDHNPEWKLIFEEEKQQINQKIGNRIIGIEHVGSTSIPNIKSKSYIDISIIISEIDLFNEEIIQALQRLDYHFFRQNGKGQDYMVFVKGYNLNGEKEQVFHIHMHPPGHEMASQVIFRNYLIANPDRAREYEQLKCELAVKYKNDRVGYRLAKNDFIVETMQMVKEEKFCS